MNLYERFESMTDEEIVACAQNADGTALECLLNKYKNFVRSKARSYFLIGADHEDIVQEGMIGLYKAIRDFRPDRLASFRAFAELCITRQIITAIKTATRQKHIPLNSYAFGPGKRGAGAVYGRQKLPGDIRGDGQACQEH